MIPLLQGRALAGGQIIVRTLVSSYIALLYLIFRNIPARGSIGKKILKLQIIDMRTNESASPKQRLIRNLFWLLDPVELFVYLFLVQRFYTAYGISSRYSRIAFIANHTRPAYSRF